ncbi:hypothetical protein [Sphingobium lignivorans]|uniref:MAE-28990/MAE-18760-like HEPN domain-containing protein n=1 Tax=Sphingobium lignivorans TaxID=2735886 RepID=A0ABR6NKB3_9SPHN|nr:hypothetical protein [Sphingobium lignivorans]MBB5986619.1 hypothetical protein [Sphingobium lignivorans]
MPATPENLYKAHVKNLRAVDTALERMLRELNASLSRCDETTSDALLKTTMLLLGAWAEDRLRKMLFEPNGFTPAERQQITSAGSQIEIWKAALERGFRKRYQIPLADLSQTLPLTPRARYAALLSVIEDDLRPIIEVRNKLAHGQWIRPLNSENDDYSPVHTQQINGENAHSVKCKHRLLEYLSQIIHDLAVGGQAFERDFDGHYSKLEHAKRETTSRSYQKWLAAMRAKYQRGRARRTGQA